MRRFMVVDIAPMFVHHFTFDINNFGVVSFDFNHNWPRYGKHLLAIRHQRTINCYRTL